MMVEKTPAEFEAKHRWGESWQPKFGDHVICLKRNSPEQESRGRFVRRWSNDAGTRVYYDITDADGQFWFVGADRVIPDPDRPQDTRT